MNSLIKFILVINIFLFFTPLYSQEPKIAYVDMDKILNQSIAGKKFTNSLEKSHKQNIKKFEKKEIELKNSEKKIISQKNILSKEDFQKQINLLRNDIQKYKEERKKIIRELTIKRQKGTTTLIQKVTPILSIYAEKNDIDIILQKKILSLVKRL